MDTDRIEGSAREIGGKIQRGVGGLMGDHSSQAEGAAREIGGRAQGLYGEAKDRLHDVVDHIGDDTQEAVRQGGQYLRSGAKAVERSVESYPILYLAAAAAAGFFASMLLNEHFDRRYFRR